MEGVIWKPTRCEEREGQTQPLFILLVITLHLSSQFFPSCRLPNIKDTSIFFLMNMYKALLAKCLQFCLHIICKLKKALNSEIPHSLNCALTSYF